MRRLGAALVLALSLAPSAGAGICDGLADGTSCTEGACEGGLCVGTYLPENTVIRAADARQNGGIFCRGTAVVQGDPLPTCTDPATGMPVECTEVPTFQGITIHVTDGAGLDYQWHWTPEHCRSTGFQFLICQEGPLKKATIRHHPGGRYPFKVAPRALDLAGPFRPPVTCELVWDTDGRAFRGTYDDATCTCTENDAPRATLLCKRCNVAAP